MPGPGGWGICFGPCWPGRRSGRWGRRSCCRAAPGSCSASCRPGGRRGSTRSPPWRGGETMRAIDLVKLSSGAVAGHRLRSVLTMPVAFGNARVEHGERGRDVFVYGVTSDMPQVWKFGVRQGRFLPEGDPRHGSPLVVLGTKLKHEVFGDANALGERVRIGGRPFRVIGVMEPKGQFLQFDLDDTVFVPVSEAMSLFNRDELFEIDVVYRSARFTSEVVSGIKRVMRHPHHGHEDVNVTDQQSMLDVLGRIIGVVSSAVGAIGGISLVVGAIGILTMMWISVNESTSEIGLLRALGARRGQVMGFFLLQAALLATAGGAVRGAPRPGATPAAPAPRAAVPPTT